MHTPPTKLVSAFIALLTLFLYTPAAFGQATGAPTAQTTELEQRGHSLKTQAAILDNGVYTNTGDLIRPNTYAKVLNNLHMLKRGVWSSRGTGFTNPGAIDGSVQTLFGFANTSNTDEIIVLSSTDAFTFNPANGSSVSIKGSYTPNSNIPTARGSYDATGTIITNGSTKIFTLGTVLGNTVTISTNWPITLSGKTYSGAQFNERYYSRHVYAGMSGFPNSIMLSQDQTTNAWVQGTPAALTDAGVISIPPYLGSITGLYNIRLNSTLNTQCLLIGCTHGLACLTGTDPSNYTISVVNDSYGIPSNHTWFTNDNDTYFLATDGIRRIRNTTNGASLISNIISMPVLDLMNRLDKANATKAFVLPHRNSQEAIFFFPVLYSGSNNTIDGDSGGTPPLPPPGNGGGIGG